MDLLLPDVPPTRAAPRIVDTTGRFSSPLSGTTRTVTRPGDRWGFRLDWENLTTVKRARLEAVIAYMRGAANRLLVSPVDFPQRGSFPSGELFPNNNNAAGVGLWTTQAANTLTAVDRRLRVTRVYYDGTVNGSVSPVNPAITLQAYTPYCIRFFALQGLAISGGLTLESITSADGFTGALTNSSTWQENVAASFGLLRGIRMPWATGSYTFGPFNPATSGLSAGDYYDIDWSSCAQCFMVDNGPNEVIQSDSFGSPWALNNCSITTDATLACDGTTTASAIVDTTSNTSHFPSQGSLPVAAASDDVMACGEFMQGTVQFAILEIQELTGNTQALAAFNLSTGALASTAAGTNWSNVRAFMVNLGQGWYYCCLIGRKTNAATSCQLNVCPAQSSSTSIYIGTGGQAIYARRVTFSQSSFPQRQIQSASAVVPALAQTGNAIYVKGLPPSTNGLLLPGDWVEINFEMKRVTNELNSDAAGRGYLIFSPPIRTSPADNDPIQSNTPMGRFIFSNNQNGWQSVPGPNLNPFGTYSLDLIEASA